MSRSRRHNPIWGICVSSSERWCKKTWHRRFRKNERHTLGTASPEALEAHLPVAEREVSNVWAMQKDGHRYHSLSDRAEWAEWSAARQGKTPHERTALKKRWMHKLMGK
ncbi:hypothetical protein F2P45_06865 [Massilia sp. CCM 8733]|uniref:Uncharacterized protein n=1 Tax=Massilia mucilaginosa TaxID=2609282 RepID=A0ABX0NPG8_9BURK|nr:hypothetical protein [Massilia mucilaginosa]